VQLVRDKFRERRPAREVILARLLEVLLIEALRSTAGTTASPGLVRGLADERIAVAIRRMHESPTRAWTVAELAKEAALSRSAFFERFSRAVGVAPMEYLLAWRMALAINMLRQNESGVSEIAERVDTAPQARSASHSAAMSDCRRRGMRAGRPNRRRLNSQRFTTVIPATRSCDHVSSRFGVAPTCDLIISASADVAGYVARQSIAEAQRMMRDIDEPLGQIVVACGASDQPHFTQGFSRLEGRSPDTERRARR
jgi:transcriptional regulator GlxA family with amidase domain